MNNHLENLDLNLGLLSEQKKQEYLEWAIARKLLNKNSSIQDLTDSIINELEEQKKKFLEEQNFEDFQFGT